MGISYDQELFSQKMTLELVLKCWLGMTFKDMVYECHVGVLNRSLRKALLWGSTLLQDCGALHGHVKILSPLFREHGLQD